MELVLILAAASGWTLAMVLLIVLPSRARRSRRRVVLRLRAHVEPYLLRRASEVLQNPLPNPTGPMADDDEILDQICSVAGRLTERERDQVALGDTMNIAVSDTMPLDTEQLPAPK